MAVIQYSGLVSQIRGKIGGTVFSKDSTGFNAYRKPVQRRTKSPAQLEIMQGMAVNATTWNLLSPEQKEDWGTIAAANPVTDRIGNTVYLTGYHFYRMITSKVWPKGLATALAPDPMAGGAQQIGFTVADLLISQTDEGSLITVLDIAGETINAISGDLKVLVWISNPIATLESQYHGTYYHVETRDVTGSGGSGLDVFILILDVLMPLGFYTFQDAIHRVRIQYIRPESGAVGVVDFATKQAVVSPPVSFPTLIIWEDPVTGPSPFYQLSSTDLRGNLFFELSGGNISDPTTLTIEVTLSELQPDATPDTGEVYINARVSPVNQLEETEIFTLGIAEEFNNLIAWYSDSIPYNPPTPTGLYIGFKIRFFDPSSGLWSGYMYRNHLVVSKP